MEESRLYKSTRNIVWRFIVLGITMIANLLIPRYIILFYGSEINGLTSTIGHILTVINLIQAGLGSSVTFLLYEPIEKHDNVRIASIIKSAQVAYRKISLGIASIGLLASIFLALSIKSNIPRIWVFIASIITCLDSSASTYLTASSNVFLGAKQDGYLLSRVSIIANIVGYLLKLIIIAFHAHFMFLYITNAVVCIINIALVRICFRNRYGPYAVEEKQRLNIPIIKIPGISYAAANESAHSLVVSLISVVVSTICGLEWASVLSVYMLVVNCIMTLSSAVYSAIVPSLGSVITSGDINTINNVFRIYQFVLQTFNTFLFMCMSYLIVPFVSIYTKDAVDASYYNPLLALFLSMYCVFYSARIPYNNLVYVKGFFKQTYLQPVICSFISIGMMIGLSFIEYSFSVIGLIFFYVTNSLYQHFVLPKLFNGFDNSHFFRHLGVSLIGVGLAISASFIIPVSPSSFSSWIIYAIMCSIICALVLLILVLIIDRNSAKMAFGYFMAKLKLVKNKKKNY